MIWKHHRWIAQGFYREQLLLLAMIMAAEVHTLLAVELLLRHSIGTAVHLVVQRAVQLLDKRVAVLAVEVVGALVPAAVLLHVGTFLKRTDKVEVWWSPEVLLPMGIVTLGPLVLLVDDGTEACLVAVDHELFKAHLLLVRLQVLTEAALIHQITNRATFLGRERQWINLLLLLIEWLNALL